MADFASMIYGTAQSAAQEQGQGLASSVQAGAGLAMKQEELDNARQMLQAKVQELTVAKYGKVADWYQAAAKMEGPMRNAFVNGYIPRGMAAMGLKDAIDPTVNEMFTKEPAIGAVMLSGIQSGKYDPGVLVQADKVAKMYPELAQIASANDIASTAQNESQQQLKAHQEALKMQQEKDIAAQKLQGELALKKVTLQQQANLNFLNTVKTVSEQQRNDFKKINEEQTSLQGAQDARDRVVASLAKDPSGRSASPQDIGGMVYSLLHSELGRVNAQELAGQLHIPGLSKGWTQDQIVKALGGVNPNVVVGLVDRLNSAVRAVDDEAVKKGASFEDQVNGMKEYSPDQKTELLNAGKSLSKPSYRDAPAVFVNGKWYDTEKVKAVMADPQHANDPMMPAFKKALGVK